MCSIKVSKTEIEGNDLQHRGIYVVNGEHGGIYYQFNSLPLSSNNTGTEQPLFKNGYCILFNGEIFNYDKKFSSDLAYIESIFTTPEELFVQSADWDGFWAFMIISENGETYCFTDSLGKKQLYFRNDKSSAASEIHAICKPSGNENRYSARDFGSDNTIQKSIRRVLPRKFYKNFVPQRGVAISSLVRSNKSLYDLIDEAVKIRLENRLDGISILLSSGLDSNIIMHHLMKYVPLKDIDIVTYRSDETEWVIKNYPQATIVERQESRRQEAMKVSELGTLDLGSVLPNYLLFEACKNSVVFSADGADELFGGYNRNLQSDTWFYDVYSELPYYHNIRLDRTSMHWTKENRCPMMAFSLLNFSKKLTWNQRKNKTYLRETYRGILSDEIINSTKKPLRDA
jgi:asparagine synthetase B (glutamine-hydrolysing)